MDSLMNRIMKASANYVPSWAPMQVGDIIMGECVLIDFHRETEDGEKLVIQIDAEFITSDGKEQSPGLYNVWERIQLRSKIESMRPPLKEGDRIAIKYCGIPKDKKYKTFAVESEQNPFLSSLDNENN